MEIGSFTASIVLIACLLVAAFNKGSVYICVLVCARMFVAIYIFSFIFSWAVLEMSTPEASIDTRQVMLTAVKSGFSIEILDNNKNMRKINQTDYLFTKKESRVETVTEVVSSPLIYDFMEKITYPEDVYINYDQFHKKVKEGV